MATIVAGFRTEYGGVTASYATALSLDSQAPLRHSAGNLLAHCRVQSGRVRRVSACRNRGTGHLPNPCHSELTERGSECLRSHITIVYNGQRSALPLKRAVRYKGISSTWCLLL